MILVIDNYDSFTYNLVQIIGLLTTDVRVIRNDRFLLSEINQMKPTHIVLSPGPGHPNSAGNSVNLIRRYGKSIPILGVCLGHQAIAVAYGGQVVQSPLVVHGKTSSIVHRDTPLFEKIPKHFVAARYHSLIVDSSHLPLDLEITAHLKDDGFIMGLQHCEYPVYGVQFHPESVASEYGPKIIENFLRIRL